MPAITSVPAQGNTNWYSHYSDISTHVAVTSHD